MSARFAQMRESLKGRWKNDWPQCPDLSETFNAFNEVLNAATALCAKRQELAASNRLSKEGLLEDVREHAHKRMFPALRNAMNTLERVRSGLKARRDALAVPKIDPSDALGAALRAEIRAWLRGMRPAELMGALVTDDVDDRVIAAALEAPPAMVGLTAQSRAQVTDHFMRKNHGMEIVRIEALEEATELLGAAIGVASYETQCQTGFDRDTTGLFDRWLTASTT